MKRLLLLLALLAPACDPYRPPHIDSFTVDNANPAPGAEVHLHYSVRDASIISIVPEPGEVTSSPVTVRPREPTTYTLRATNLTGAVSGQVTVNARSSGAASILEFSVAPSQAPAGTPRTIAWKIHNGIRIALDGALSGRIGVAEEGQYVDAPTETTTYTIYATSSVGFVPGQVSAQAMARVVEPAAITSFTATPAALLQGEAATLRWDGTALGWSIAATNGATTNGSASNGSAINLGIGRSLLVRPAATTTYSLTGVGPGGAAGPQLVTVTVTPRVATTLAYTPPLPGGETLRLRADDCPAPCAALTLRLVAAAAVGLRGVSINLPLDSLKLSLDAASFQTGLDAGKAVLGTGPLRDRLVLGAALKGGGAAPAADRALAAGDELLHFAVALQPQGGQGVVFDGAAAFAAFIQSASGRTPGGIAVGKLEAK